MKRIHAVVKGHVQGVFFRAFTQEHAQRLGVTGWVRNRPDGTVELIAEGEDVALARLVLALEKGPPMSHVDEVHVTYERPVGEFTDFRLTE